MERRDLIKGLQASPLRGGPFDLAKLGELGISPQLAAKYVRSGWLFRLAQGVYSFPEDELGAHRIVQFLQARVDGLHVGGKSVLSLQGVSQNLTVRERFILWGDERFRLPQWVQTRFSSRYVPRGCFSGRKSNWLSEH